MGVVATFDAIIFSLFQKGSCLIKNSERTLVIARGNFNRCDIYQNTELVLGKFSVRESLMKEDSRFVKRPFAPVTNGQVGLSFCNLVLVAKSFK